jgi:hypothetical protein
VGKEGNSYSIIIIDYKSKFIDVYDGMRAAALSPQHDSRSVTVNRCSKDDMLINRCERVLLRCAPTTVSCNVRKRNKNQKAAAAFSSTSEIRSTAPEIWYYFTQSMSRQREDALFYCSTHTITTMIIDDDDDGSNNRRRKTSLSGE